MPTLDNYVASTRVAQMRAVYTGTIPATAGASTGLQSLSIPLEPSLAQRRVYCAFVVDDVRNFTLTGNLSFRLQGNAKLDLPVRLGDQLIGWDGSATVTRIATLPVWGVERHNYLDARNVSILPATPSGSALQTAWTYSDTRTQWLYRVTMAPLVIVGAFDELLWTPESFFGLAELSQVMQATVLAVISDER